MACLLTTSSLAKQAMALPRRPHRQAAKWQGLPNELRDWCGAKPPHNHQLNQAARTPRSTWGLSRVESWTSGRGTCLFKDDSSGSWPEEARCLLPVGASRIRRPVHHGRPGVADPVREARGNVKPTALAYQFGAH